MPGREKAAALGRWFASFEPDAQPEILLASTYIRAVQTAKLFGAAGRTSPSASTSGCARRSSASSTD
ncbi:histidine phosphatase family protein [Novosphingobium panipatense]|uniref:histidine phosphatase family protein n=1 Tax=Novosphingobium panipatense TaxID=428991 RepID=UPI0039A24BA8